MPITAVDLTGGNGFSDATASSYVTGSVTPTDASVVWLGVALRQADLTGRPTQPTITGLGSTWTFVTSVYFDTTTTRGELFLFRGVGHTGAPGTVTINPGVNHVGCVWNLSETTGVDTVTPIVAGQTVTLLGDAAGNTITLPSAPTAGNATLSWCAAYNASLTQEGGHTLLGLGGPATGNSNLTVGADFAADPGDQTHTWTFPTATHGMIAIEPKAGAAGGTVVHSVVGGVRSDSVSVVAKLTGASSAVLRVATDAGLTQNIVNSTSQTPDGNGHVKFTLGGLTKDTDYHYGIRVDGQTSQVAKRGRFHTHPSIGTIYSFTFTHASCVNNPASTNAQNVMREIMDQQGPLFHAWCGDFNYGDDTAAGPMRTSYDTQLANATLAEFVRTIPFEYGYSDHDFLGNNVGGDENATTQSQRLVRATVLRDYFPIRDPGDAAPDGPLYRSWQIGRVLFVMADERWHKKANADTDNASKVMWGSAQRTWFQSLLSSTGAKAVVLIHDTPWQAPTVANDDDWGAYTTERTTIADIIDAAGLPCIHLHGDAHQLACADTSVASGLDFTTAQVGTVPTFVGCAAAWDQSGSSKGGPYRISRLGATNQESQGAARYGLMTVTDTGSNITFSWEGRNATSQTASSVLVPTDGAPLTLMITAPAQVTSPSADAHVGTGWQNEVGGTTNLWQSIDEADPVDTDFVRSPNDPTSSAVYVTTLGTDPVENPNVTTGHIASYRYKKTNVSATPTINLTVQLRQNYVSEASQGTLIASRVHNGISTAWTTQNVELTAGEAGAITYPFTPQLRFIFEQV